MPSTSLTRNAVAFAALLMASGLTAACGQAMPASNRTQHSDGSSPSPSPSPDDAGRPTRIAINHNDFEAKHVGYTADGRQFFLTTPFDPGTYAADDARVFVALYLFDKDGRFLKADVDAFEEDGPSLSAAARKIYQQRLRELGKVKLHRIEIEPFAVKRFGLIFGLVTTAPTSTDDTWWVNAEPGDYMAFSPPWDLGDYDT